MNVVAFSLYGTGAKYVVGAVENARLVKRHYPGWECHVWVKPDVPMEVCETLKWNDAILHSSVFPNGMFDRFLAHDLPGVERYIVRDVDSRIGAREAAAVGEWIKEGTQLHVMRDHPYHSQGMMGGMWGWWVWGAVRFNMDRACRDIARDIRYGRDQEFLIQHAWSLPATRTVHDSCGTFDGTRNWPVGVGAVAGVYGGAFVGEYIDEHGRPNYEHRGMRGNWLRKCAHEARAVA